MNYVYIVTAVKRLLWGGPSLLQAARKDILVAAAVLPRTAFRRPARPNPHFDYRRSIARVVRLAARRTEPRLGPVSGRCPGGRCRYDLPQSGYSNYMDDICKSGVDINDVYF